ncbi:MAG: MBL fold metallo-hydrolase [Oscillospiraceae bacterium]|nr:MBL fold metallo-hydrolase [Oscillospiraceae bacterium]
MNIDKIDNGLFKIRIPFEEITTTVYIYVCEQGVAIIDSATYSSDVDEYIIPALDTMNIPYDDVKYLLLTHNHSDHAGGIRRLSENFPNAMLCTSFNIDLSNRIDLVDDKTIFGNLKAIYLPGHTEHSFGFYDTFTKTLLSGDCLQLDGIGKYRNGIKNFDRYIESVNKLKCIDINRIVAAHEYDPFGSTAVGKRSVMRYLNKCNEIAKEKIKRLHC